MNYSLNSVPFYCAVLLPKCIINYLYGISVKNKTNRALILPLTITGVLLPMLAILAMRGSSILTMANRTTTIRQIAIMCGALGQESKNHKKNMYV
jgi:hypothetical protein